MVSNRGWPIADNGSSWQPLPLNSSSFSKTSNRGNFAECRLRTGRHPGAKEFARTPTILAPIWENISGAGLVSRECCIGMGCPEPGGESLCTISLWLHDAACITAGLCSWDQEAASIPLSRWFPCRKWWFLDRSEAKVFGRDRGTEKEGHREQRAPRLAQRANS